MTGRRLVLTLAILAALAAWWIWRDSPSREIARRLAELEELVEKSGPESSIDSLANARAITLLFAPHFEVRAEQLGFSTRDRQQLAGFIHGHRSTSNSIDMRIAAGALSFLPEHGRATQEATFHFLSGGPLGSGSERYRVQINWLDGDDGWRMDYVDLIEIVEAPFPLPR